MRFFKRIKNWYQEYTFRQKRKLFCQMCENWLKDRGKLSILLLCFLVGCIDNSMLPEFVQLPFEGCGRAAQIERENQAELMTEAWRTEGHGVIILEVEGACDGYATGAAWITCYEEKVAPISTLLGAGHGPDGMASTDSRPCLRYEIQPEVVDDFMLSIIECAIETGMWRVYFNRQTGIVDGEPEFDCIELWEAN